MRTIVALLSMLFVSIAGLGQQGSSPSPANGPSLPVTLQFISDKLNSVGSLAYSISFNDTATGKDWVNQFVDEVSKVAGAPDQCLLRYHERLAVDGQVRFDSDYLIPLKEVHTVLVLTVEQDLKRHGNNPTWERKLSMPIWSLWVERPNRRIDSLYFRDAETANRVEKAVNHAVELCGGQIQHPEPF